MASIFPPYSLASLQLKHPESLVQTHIQLRIPKSRHADPVISNLISRYGLKVNILGTLLGIDGYGDGWFDLEINGKAAMVRSTLSDLIELEAEIWMNPETNDGL
jgi:hypothetical protein